MLDCPVGTVKSRCSRGGDWLATLLGVLRPGGEERHLPPGHPDPLPSVRTTEASRAPPDLGCSRPTPPPTPLRLPPPPPPPDPRAPRGGVRPFMTDQPDARPELPPGQESEVRRLLA